MAVLQCRSPCLWIAADLKPRHFVLSTFFYMLVFMQREYVG